MSLVRIFSPQTQSEVAVVTALLEAHEIPVFVHNRGFGSLLPGLLINAYNTQSIMVPEEHAADAMELLAEFQAAPVEAAPPNLTIRDRLRIVFEAIFFGWFVPGRSRDSAKDKAQSDANESPERTRGQ